MPPAKYIRSEIRQRIPEHRSWRFGSVRLPTEPASDNWWLYLRASMALNRSAIQLSSYAPTHRHTPPCCAALSLYLQSRPWAGWWKRRVHLRCLSWLAISTVHAVL